MSDSTAPDNQNKKDSENEDNIGVPNWENRDSEDLDMSDWDPDPMAGKRTEQTEVSADESSSDEIDVSRYTINESDEMEDDEQSQEALPSVDSKDGKENLEETTEIQTPDFPSEDSTESTTSETNVEDEVEGDPETPKAPVFELPEGWEARPAAAIENWAEKSERYKSLEAFKNGLVLPLFSSLGYNPFDPDSIEPLEGETGRLDGYLAKSGSEHIVVLLDEAEIPDDYREDVTMRAKRDKISIGVRIENDGEARWQMIAEMDLKGDASVHALKYVHHDAFNKETIMSMANQVHGQQDDIIEAVKFVITTPGNGFVEDVRQRLENQGHPNPLMLAERVSLAVARLLSDQEDQTEEEESKQRRQLTPEEIRAVEIIREQCAPEISPGRIVPRAGQSYVAILLDDNNRRSIARLHFSAATVKYISTFSKGDESKERIAHVNDIASYREAIRGRAQELDPSSFPAPDEN